MKDVSFADVAEDAIGCFATALSDVPEFATCIATLQANADKANACMEGAKSQVVRDMAGFKIVKDRT